MTAELTASVENALKAFNETKTMVEGLATKHSDVAKNQTELSAKLDAFDLGKINKMAEDIGKAAEESQKAAAFRKAQEDQAKSFEAKLTALETVLSRPGFGAQSSQEKEAEQKAKGTKLFNDFARMRSENREGFDEFARKALSNETEIKALSVNSDPNGGYLTTPTMGGIIQTKIYESSPMRDLADSVTIGSDTYEVLLDNDQASAGWVGETSSVRANTGTGNPTVGKLAIQVNEMVAQPSASQKLLDDATVDVEAWLGGKVADLFARTEATAFVSGNGVMKPKGILSYTAGTDITQQQIQQIVTGSNSTFQYSGLVNLQTSLKEPYQANATFLTQRASIANLMMIVDGQARPIFNTMFDKNVGMETTIMGRPLRFAADMPTVATNALALAYGDFKKAYLIVDRIGIRVLRDPYSSKPYILFYTTKRTGGGVINFEAMALQKIST
jgi:HK97 family phage major capsid protein